MLSIWSGPKFVVWEWVKHCREENVRNQFCLLLRAISPFPTVFSKDLYCRHAKTKACLGKGLKLG